MRRNPILWWCVLLLAPALCQWGCSDEGESGTNGTADPPDLAEGEKPGDALRKYFEELQQAIRGDDTKKAGEMTKELFPGRVELVSALKEDVEPDVANKIVDFHWELAPRDEAGMAKVFQVKPEQTEIKVWAATTEEIAANEEGSVAFAEFPGGAKRLAKTILRPGQTFYEVEFLEPGKDAGMKYHLFYWSGKKWSMLGPIWRKFP